jgi:hypothetical protein
MHERSGQLDPKQVADGEQIPAHGRLRLQHGAQQRTPA